MNSHGSMLLLMHTHDSLLKENKIAYLCKLSVVFCFFLSERVLLLPVKINAINTSKAMTTATHFVCELNYRMYTITWAVSNPGLGRVYYLCCKWSKLDNGKAKEWGYSNITRLAFSCGLELETKNVAATGPSQYDTVCTCKVQGHHLLIATGGIITPDASPIKLIWSHIQGQCGWDVDNCFSISPHIGNLCNCSS